MNVNGMSDDEKNARLEMMGALPGFKAVAGATAQIIEDALAPVLEGQRKYSCLHAVDESWRTPLGGEMGTSRTAFLCTQHPEKLLCDSPADRHGPGCAIEHMRTEHADEVPAICFVCSQPIEEMLLTPVYAKVQLHEPLTVYTSHDREYQYLGTLRTLPITYLCPRHAPMFDVEKPWVAHWPMTPDTAMGV